MKVLIIAGNSLLDASATGADGASGGTIGIAPGVSTIVSGGVLPADVSSESGAQGAVTTPIAFAPSRVVTFFPPERRATMRCGVSRAVNTLADRISGRAYVGQDPATILPYGPSGDLDQIVTAAAARLCSA